ncbi:GntR family transcriptional regulator [Vagococcus coleopterorum]|uniref:GntR family transcriptional regulator n=1 Tax=Vagococcus coleopterorum TaxID=2714946 RepID=A0A6G8AN77_9ENTE|nr:GntR family transcriptional regulator [Vagococcus coleopterorum]QIL46534.1 GntR family transcriptional regulator [Vagococcus coleopterorum]
MIFDFENGVPLYLQVATQIEQGILQGSFKEGEQVPSTTEISKSYNINPATVLKGMNQLVADGVIEKRRGIGMFVTDTGVDKIFKKRATQFAEERLAEFITEAKQLGISKEELVDLIERGYSNE